MDAIVENPPESGDDIPDELAILRHFDDIHIPDVGAETGSILYKDAMPNVVNDLVISSVMNLHRACHDIYMTSVDKGRPKYDFMVMLGTMRFRVRVAAHAIDGLWFRLRRQSEVAPTIDKLPSPMASAVERLAMSPKISRGGLIYIAGTPGSGKTHTASAILVSRLQAFGGFAYTIEDPPELPLNGWHNSGDAFGYCTQNLPAEDSHDPWAMAIQEALRSQPAGAKSMLYIGEVRAASCARTMLRAALNGFLVIATGFGQDALNALESFIRLAATDGDTDSVCNDLANCLKLIVHQRKENDRIEQTFLMVPSASSSVASGIRKNNIGSLKDEIGRQRTNAANIGKAAAGVAQTLEFE